jgi:Tol biopolymer transport system component
MNGDGTNVEQLTNCPSKCFQPSWSPSGEYIAYVSANHPDYDIYVMKANGSEQKRLTQGGMNVHPAWSPDGERIAFIKSVGLKWSGPLYLMNPDGSGMTALTDDSSCVRHMSWSPAGRFIVYEKYCASTLWIMDVQTSKTRPITYGGGAYAPAWSP